MYVFICSAFCFTLYLQTFPSFCKSNRFAIISHKGKLVKSTFTLPQKVPTKTPKLPTLEVFQDLQSADVEEVLAANKPELTEAEFVEISKNSKGSNDEDYTSE